VLPEKISKQDLRNIVTDNFDMRRKENEKLEQSEVLHVHQAMCFLFIFSLPSTMRAN